LSAVPAKRHGNAWRVVGEMVEARLLALPGFGPALGPAAADVVRNCFEALGYAVTTGASDWVMGPKDRDIQTELLGGWARAA